MARIEIRHAEAGDHGAVMTVIDDWWEGRAMRAMLPKLFFVHFRETSFTAVTHDKIVGFLIGFLSQTFPDQAYIHFAGVHPAHRRQGLGRRLYERFFSTAKAKGCRIVRCVTSPVNKRSIAFHQKMGFRIEPGSETIDGLSLCTDYDGTGEHRVLFVKELVV